MDKKMKKKMAAAIAGVSAYIKSQEEMAAAMQAAPVEEAPKPVAIPSLWGVSGRLDIMQMRNMMQMKTFHGVR